MSLTVKRISLILAVLILTFAGRGSAQVRRGETSMNLNGTIAAGYTDDYTNLGTGDHSIMGAGTADLFGSYFSPNFLSFDIQPFYNQSRVNSNFQSLTSSSGVNASAKIFGGSQYPGSISYSRSLNSSGTFDIPGLANFTTHGNNDVLALTWGAHPTGLPSLNFSFSNADSDYSVYGANTRGTLHSDTFSVTSAYTLDGFHLNGGYQYNRSNALTPEFLTNLAAQHTNSGANSFAFGVGHDLPWHGTFSAAATRLDINTSLGDSTASNTYNTNIDTVTSAVTFAPKQHLSVGADTYYTDLIVVAGIAGDANRPQDFRVLAYDEHAARRWNHPALGNGGEGPNERWLLGRTFRQFSRPESHTQRSPGLAVRKLEAEKAGAVLPLEGDYVTARVEHCDSKQRKVLLTALRDCRINNRVGLGQFEYRHNNSFLN